MNIYKNDQEELDPWLEKHRHEFVPEWLTIEKDEFFDYPSSARLLVGLVGAFNEYSKNQTSTYIYFNRTSKVVNFAFNCDKEVI